MGSLSAFSPSVALWQDFAAPVRCVRDPDRLKTQSI